MTSCGKATHQLDQLMPMIRETLAAGRTVTFQPSGISMLPMLHQGVDRVTLSPLPEQLKKYDLPLYQRENGQYILHRIVKAGAVYTCCGDNQYLPEPNLRPEQMIALVTSFTHKGKRISVTHPLYRLYCWYWCTSRPARYMLFRVRRKLRRLLGGAPV